MLKRLRPDVRIDVRYDDRTPFGSPVGRRPEQSVQAVFAPIMAHVEAHGFRDLVSEGPRLLAEATDTDAFACIADRLPREDWRIKAEVLYPDPAASPPHGIVIAPPDGDGLGGAFPLAAWPTLHTLISALVGPGVDDPASLGAASGLLSNLEDAGLVETVDDPPPPDPVVARSDLTFVGHNTVVVRSRSSAVIVDPWLVPHDASYPEHYQPLQLRHLGPIDAAVITHSHPDHFAPATLLQLPRSTRMIVPRVERETVLATAMASRLRELGFTDVLELEWWDSTRVNDIEVFALPFHGEQPTDGEQLHPDIRNAGNTYFLRTPTFSAAFLADSGRDGAGDARDVAGRARREIGSPDLLFVGYRGWLTYPVQLLFTSVARYILFVPRHLWSVRQRLMTTADEAVDLAEIWGAPHLVPYADGGAPWYWNIGLGPRLDDAPQEASGFDPLPERVRQAALSRTEMPGGLLGSHVQVLLVRPGDSIVRAGSAPAIMRADGFAWPYREEVATAASSAMLG